MDVVHLDGFCYTSWYVCFTRWPNLFGNQIDKEGTVLQGGPSKFPGAIFRKMKCYWTSQHQNNRAASWRDNQKTWNCKMQSHQSKCLQKFNLLLLLKTSLSCGRSSGRPKREWCGFIQRNEILVICGIAFKEEIVTLIPSETFIM